MQVEYDDQKMLMCKKHKDEAIFSICNESKKEEDLFKLYCEECVNSGENIGNKALGFPNKFMKELEKTLTDLKERKESP